MSTRERPSRPMRGMRRKTIDASHLVETSFLPGHENGLPLVLVPAVENVDLAEWALSHRDELEGYINRYGGLLFRGFGVDSAAEFERVASAIVPDLFAEYGDLPPEPTSQRIYGSTPYPADKMILFHNESSHLPSWPLRQFFACILPSETGGETPLIDCRRICDALDPELLAEFERKGLMYVRNFSQGVDVPWQEFSPEDMPRNVHFGDGTPIPDEVIDRIGELYEELCVEFPWEAGDMVVLDNMLVSHARRPFGGSRKILVAMGEMTSAT